MSCENPNCPEPWPHEHYVTGNEKDGYRTATRRVSQPPSLKDSGTLRVKTPEERIEWLVFQVAVLMARVNQMEKDIERLNRG